ncbi:S-type anion channel SLAH1 isoform X2 [Jatropha curcas]|uniref:S-type anion channel SLAH1 isoform X2 n=1 Tax=Jatropha curcas TaxID=180498 RepID=UPI0009D68A6C|nr:S-type anion channel SLAH1 isoform X2 [Jatropha curcas]
MFLNIKMEVSNSFVKNPKPHIHIVIELSTPPQTPQPPQPPPHYSFLNAVKESLVSLLARFHAGYFRISLSLCSQALLLKILRDESITNPHSLRRVFQGIPSLAFVLLWSIAFFITAFLSFVYIFRCFFHFKLVKDEFLHHVGVNYLFAPWISWLLLLQSSPFFNSKSIYYLFLFWVFVVPMLVLDVKIYGQWFTKGKRSLSIAANPTSQLSVIGNLVGAQAAAEMGWREISICMFSLGMSHYLVLFVTLYQRLSEGNCVPTMLRPVFFLFIAAPSMASLAWNSISGSFDNLAKMLFFLSLFLFLSLNSSRDHIKIVCSS